MKSRKVLILTLGMLGVMMLAATSAVAYDRGGYGGGYDGGYGDRNDEPQRAASYINRDTGAATENSDVNRNSNCSSPDRYDTQRLSDPGSVNRNVHNDACFFRGYRSGGNLSDVDAPATFDSSGVGYISACPDPDGAGPKVAVLSDRNGDGRADRCFQSGYQDMGARGVADVAGDFQFHARVNNDSKPGTQTVVWGYDPDRDGVSDTRVKDTIRVNWVR